MSQQIAFLFYATVKKEKMIIDAAIPGNTENMIKNKKRLRNTAC